MTRVLAHNVTFEGKTYKMSIVEISDDRQSVVITPYSTETPFTIFVSGSVSVTLDPDGLYTLTPIQNTKTQ